MASITPPGKSGAGREAIGDRLSLIRASPRSPALVTLRRFVVERRPDEATPEEFLDNPRRRVGRIHDEAERRAGSPAASNCPNVTIYAHWAADPSTLAARRRRRAGMLPQNVSQISRLWNIEVSAKGFSAAGEDAGMRFADLTAEGARSFQELDDAGRIPASPEWQDIGLRRDRDCLVGLMVRNDRDESTIVLLNHHALSQLYEDGYVLITADETVYDSWEISEPNVLDSIRRFMRVARGIVTELDGTADLIVKVTAAGTAVAAVLRYFKVI